ncbi:unnamed protein product, partial [Pylaiella littoralis]
NGYSGQGLGGWSRWPRAKPHRWHPCWTRRKSSTPSSTPRLLLNKTRRRRGTRRLT